MTRSQWYLTLVAAGWIGARPRLAGIDGRTVYFTDGTRTEVDAIVCGTGDPLDLPMRAPTRRSG